MYMRSVSQSYHSSFTPQLHKPLPPLPSLLFVHYLYSSLCPYAITMSVNSFITVSAHLFISCSALRSFGFSKPWPSENLSYDKSERNEVKPLSDFVKNIFAHVPVKISSIYSNNDPAVHKALIVLFKPFYIFVSDNFDSKHKKFYLSFCREIPAIFTFVAKPS